MQHKYTIMQASACRLSSLLGLAAFGLLLCVQDAQARDNGKGVLPPGVDVSKLELPKTGLADPLKAAGKNREKARGKKHNKQHNNDGGAKGKKNNKKNKAANLPQDKGVSAELVQPNTNLILSPEAAQQAHDAGLLDPKLNFVPGQPLDVGSPVTNNGVSLSSGGRITGVIKTNNGIVVFFAPPGQPDSNAFSILLDGVNQFEPPIIDGHGGPHSPRAATAEEQLQLALPRRFTTSSAGSPAPTLSPTQKNQRKWLKLFDNLLGTNYTNEGEPDNILAYLIYIQVSLQLEESLRGFIADYPPSSNFLLNVAMEKLRADAPSSSPAKIADKIMEYGEKAPGAGYGAEFEQLQSALKARLLSDWEANMNSFDSAGISGLWDELTSSSNPPSAAREAELYAAIESKLPGVKSQWTRDLWQLQIDHRRGRRLNERLYMPYDK